MSSQKETQIIIIQHLANGTYEVNVGGSCDNLNLELSARVLLAKTMLNLNPGLKRDVVVGLTDKDDSIGLKMK